MRLRYLLPAIDVAASITFVFIPLWNFRPYYRPIGPDGREMVCIDNCPHPHVLGIDSTAFATGFNLPAAAVVGPVLLVKWDYSQDGHEYLHDPYWRGIGFALCGIVVWFFVGRLLDDVVEWRRTRILPSLAVSDLVFALVTAGTMTWAATALASAGLWYVFWVIAWMIIGYLGTLMRLFQWHNRKRPALLNHP